MRLFDDQGATRLPVISARDDTRIVGWADPAGSVAHLQQRACRHERGRAPLTGLKVEGWHPFIWHLMNGQVCGLLRLWIGVSLSELSPPTIGGWSDGFIAF